MQNKANIIEKLVGHINGKTHSKKYKDWVYNAIKECGSAEELVAALDKLRAVIEKDPGIMYRE